MGDHPRRRDERGAILVLTSISMIVLMGFTAVAIDLGQRNQKLAAAQHAIDAAVLGAAQYLSAHDSDYEGASRRVKTIIEQNLGIAAGDWSGCSDADRLDIVALNDTSCISFRRVTNAANGQVKNDIRVRLPRFQMDTIFGSALGIDSLDLAAAAASNGNNCGPTGTQSCVPGTTVPETTTTEPPITTTTTLAQYCGSFTPPLLALYTDVWTQCASELGGFDIEAWRTTVCNQETFSFDFNGFTYTWTLDGRYRYIWYWNMCQNYTGAGTRETWFGQVCYSPDLSLVWTDWTLWSECRTRRPSIEDWDHHWATTTTQAPSPTTAAPTTTQAPPSSVPSSIDLSS